MLDQLCPEDLPLLWADGGGTAGRVPRIERPCFSALLPVALDRRDADAEECGHLARSFACIERGHDALPQVEGICMHTLSMHPRPTD
jgi:hypothetical protein